MKLLRVLLLTLALCVTVQNTFAQGMTAIISYCGIENTLGCGCDQSTRVPFADGTNSWCVFWDRTANGADGSDLLVEVGNGLGQANYNCAAFNGEAICGIAGNFASEFAFYVENPPASPDEPVYFIKASGSNCCWVSDTFRLNVGLQDITLADGAFDCSTTPCPIGAAPTAVTNVTATVDQFCLETNVTWQHNGENVSGFGLYTFDTDSSVWVFQAQVGDTFRSASMNLCLDGPVTVGVQAANGSQTADIVSAVGGTFLRHYDDANPIVYLGNGDIQLNLVMPPQGQQCEAFLYFDLYCGGSFVEHLCEVTSPDELTLLQIACTLPGAVPSPDCYILMRDSAAAPLLPGCVLTDTLFVNLDNNERPEITREFALSQNYPNPFNPSTTIEYSVPTSGDVELAVFNLAGQKVATLVSGNVNAGSHSVAWNGAGVASGVYFYRLQAADQIMTRKMLLLK